MDNSSNSRFDSSEDSGSEADQCQICYEDIKIYAITPCNHNMTCAQCHYKMRVKENNKCTMCKVVAFAHFFIVKQENETIILTLSPDILFDRLDFRKMTLSEKAMMYFQNEEVKRQFDLILEINCPHPGCSKSFPTVVLYKNHIKRDHRKFVW